MNELVVNNIELAKREYNGQRVITLKDIDLVHGRVDGTARKRFNDNKGHFIEGEDYYVLNQPSEIRTLGIARPQGGVPSSVILITESGYLMLVKSFTDDLAWSVQRQLVKNYFRVKKLDSYLIDDPAERARRWAEEYEERKALMTENKRLAPKADYADKVCDDTSLFTTTAIAKDFGMSARVLNSLLNSFGIQYKSGNQWVLYAKYQSDGYTHCVNVPKRNGRGYISEMKWTQAGKYFLYEILRQKGFVPTFELKGVRCTE